MRALFGQPSGQVRFDWGLTGALALTGQPGTAAVVVDVLSFTTSVSVAAGLGIEVLPFRWRDDRAAEFAVEHGAELAGGRGAGGPSLSPASIQAWAGDPPSVGGTPRATSDRLVLPSPNGSSICFALAERGNPVIAGCLRNAAAVAGWLAAETAAGRVSAVAVIAAGEHWPDGSLRPAVEDLWGAGAVLDRLSRVLPGLPFTPEARAAAAAFTAIEPDVAAELAGCTSGRELIEDGFDRDVALAADLDADPVVPVLDGRRFRPT